LHEAWDVGVVVFAMEADIRIVFIQEREEIFFERVGLLFHSKRPALPFLLS
jgi:hypothetical protein